MLPIRLLKDSNWETVVIRRGETFYLEGSWEKYVD